MQDKKLILFDIDKTLIKEMERSENPWPLAFEKTYGVNCEISSGGANSHGRTHKKIAIDTLKEKGFSDKNILEKLEEFIKNLDEFYPPTIEKGKILLFDKISELLQELSNKEYILGLITGNTQKIAYSKLNKVNIGNFFELGGFGDQGITRNEILKLAIKRANEKYKDIFKSKNIFVIGDTPQDILAAEGLDLNTIGVATGKYSKEDLKKAGADFVLDNLQDIDKVLEIIENSSH